MPGITISVGNIVTGGTGKSPAVVAIAASLQAQGHRPAIVSRGYKSGLAGDQFKVLLAGNTIAGNADPTADIRLDEAMMQSMLLPQVPIIAGAKRWQAVNCFLTSANLKPTHWLLDDGFQHWQLARDFDLVLLDSERPFNNGRLLPAGHLREPLSALKRADAVVFTRSRKGAPAIKDRKKAQQACPIVVDAPAVFGQLKQVAGPISPRQANWRWGVMAGIAKPERFLLSAKDLGLLVEKHWFIGDHERFGREALKDFCGGLDALLVTEKDYWRQPDLYEISLPVFVLPMSLSLPASLLQLLNELK